MKCKQGNVFNTLRYHRMGTNNLLFLFINQLTTICIEMPILYETIISMAGHYKPEIPKAAQYKITAMHYEL